MGAWLMLAAILVALYARHGLRAGASIVASGGRCRREEAVMADLSMLRSTRGTRIPTRDKLAAASSEIGRAVTLAEQLSMCLEWTMRGEEAAPKIDLTAEQAWNLAYFAKGLEYDAANLRCYSKTIEDAAHALYAET